jgi:hypothetical protein
MASSVAASEPDLEALVVPRPLRHLGPLIPSDFSPQGTGDFQNRDFFRFLATAVKTVLAVPNRQRRHLYSYLFGTLSAPTLHGPELRRSS